MVKSLNIDKLSKIVVIELNKDELKNVVDSVYYMADEARKNLLKNLPADQEDRNRLDNFNALKEDLRRVLDSLN